MTTQPELTAHPAAIGQFPSAAMPMAIGNPTSRTRRTSTTIATALISWSLVYCGPEYVFIPNSYIRYVYRAALVVSRVLP